MNIRKFNRIQKRSPKLGKFWCPSCDRAMVQPGRKCRVCGKLASRKRNK